MGLFSGVMDAVTSVAKPITSVISPVAPLLGAGVGAVGSYLGTQSANEANVAQTQAQMDFQREMSNTSYQRAVEDMKKAGLNPMLAYSQGGASTPQGGAARIENALGNAVNSASASMQTGINYIGALQTIENQKAQEANIDASTANISADTVLKVLEAEHIPQKVKNTIADTYLKGVQARMTTALSQKEEYMMPMHKQIGASWNSAGGAAAAYGRLLKENTPGVKIGPFEIGIK